MDKFAPHLHFYKAKMLSASGGFAPDQWLCRWIRYRLTLRAYHEPPTIKRKFMPTKMHTFCKFFHHVYTGTAPILQLLAVLGVQVP